MGWKRAAVVSGGLAFAVAGLSCEAFASAGCQAINGNINNVTPQLFGTGFTAGDVITITVTNNGGSNSSTSTAVFDASAGFVTLAQALNSSTLTYTIPTTTTHNYHVGLAAFVPTSTATIVCVSAAGGGSTGAGATTTTTPAIQLANNAQTGIANGQQTLRSYMEWVNKDVISSFNFGPSGNPSRYSAAGQPRPPSTSDRLAKAADKVRDLGDQLAALQAQSGALDEEQAKDIEKQLAAARRELMFARRNAAIASSGGEPRVASTNTSGNSYAIDNATPAEVASLRAEEQGASTEADGPAVAATKIYEGPIGDAQQARAKTPPIHFDARDLAAYCDSDCDVLGNKWNVWGQGRIIGATDSLAQTNAFGFVGSVGGDYKLQPWLALGLSVGVESFSTAFSSNAASSASTGVSAVPYVGIRLADNVALSAMAGVSSLAYNNSPMAGVTAQFQALRTFVGGSLTGVWRDGPWRFQPIFSGTYGWENQYGYTDSAGNVVPGQTITYGRLSTGPEIGYSIKSSQSGLIVEPFVTAKASVDFASNSVTLFNGTPIVVRSGPIGSGSTGVGLVLQFDNGFYARGELSYDSIGVTGLDIWSALLRGGFTF